LATLPSYGMFFVNPQGCGKIAAAPFSTESKVEHKQPCQLDNNAKLNIEYIYVFVPIFFLSLLLTYDPQINHKTIKFQRVIYSSVS